MQANWVLISSFILQLYIAIVYDSLKSTFFMIQSLNIRTRVHNNNNLSLVLFKE